MDADDLRVHQDLSALFADLFRGHVPELTGAELRIRELLDQRGFDLAVLFAGLFFDRVLQNRHDRHALDALRAPGRIDFRRMSSPEVFGIILEKHRIELLPETVDIEILQRFFLSLVHHGFQIGEADFHCFGEAHVPEGLRLEGNRIIVKLGVEENTGYAVSAQHDAILILRIRSARIQRHLPAQRDIVRRRRALPRHHLIPPFVDFRHLCEKAVAAHIHAVALIFHGSRDAAELSALLENIYVHIVRLVQKLIGGGQAGRAGTDHKRCFSFVLHSN